MTLSELAKADLRWWLENLITASKPISHGFPDTVIFTDASDAGYGYSRPDAGSAAIGGGRWNTEESDKHINQKEMLAVWFGLNALCSNDSGKHIKIMTDNQTTLSYIRDFGGSHSLECNALARSIWIWARERNMWLSIAHVPGVCNVVADRASRQFAKETEWMLDKQAFSKIRQVFPDINLDIDLFASRQNSQLQTFVSWKPDPDAFAIDAFTMNWGTYSLYAFPPFSIINRVLQKMTQDRAEGILVVPDWPTQAWYPTVQRMLVRPPLVIRARKTLLQIQGLNDRSTHCGRD
jgi:hypothetical protein